MARRAYRPIDPDRLPDVIADELADLDPPGPALRVAIDGPRSAQPHMLADRLVEPLRLRGRVAVHISAELFWRDASLRFEHGRTDPDAFRDEWLDTAALRREVLDPLGAGGSGRYLPSLRDPVTNRTTREPAGTASPGTVLLVSGELLLGLGLPFDRTVHLAVGRAARARRMPPEWAWTLPAFDAYDRDVDPVGQADVVIRLDDPAHPAISAPTPL